MDLRTFSSASAINLLLSRSCEFALVSDALFVLELILSDFVFLESASLIFGFAFGDLLLLDLLEVESFRSVEGFGMSSSSSSSSSSSLSLLEELLLGRLPGSSASDSIASENLFLLGLSSSNFSLLSDSEPFPSE